MNKIMIFGAGLMGQYALRFFGEDNVIGFTDNDESRSGQDYFGKKIWKPAELLNIEYPMQVVIANHEHYSDIQQQLENMGIKESVIFLWEYVDIKRALKNITQEVMLVTDNEDDIFHKYLEFHLKYIPVPIKSYTIEEYELLEEKEAYIPIYIYSRKHHAEIDYLLRNEKNVTDILLWILWSGEEIVMLPTKEEWNRESQEDDWIALMEKIGRFDSIDRYINLVSDQKEVKLFKLIELETINRCNSLCQFCAANASAPQRPKKYMSDELLHKIVQELKALDYRGQVCMYSANEPFLDPNIIERVKYTKRNLPNAKINITTNGTLLTLEKYLDVIEFVDEFIVNNYTTERGLRENLQEIVDYCKEHPEKDYKEKTSIRIRKIDEKLAARAGNSPNRTDAMALDGHACALVYQEMVIAPDGKVKLCASDVMGECIVGDVSRDSLVDVWYGETMNSIREKLLDGRKNVEICAKCDYCYIV